MHLNKIAANQKRLISVGLAAAMLLVTSIAAFAAFFTINTNDAAIDGNWPASAFLTDPTGDIAPSNFDLINNMYMGSDAVSPTEFYFRAELAAALVGNDTVSVVIDCNNNSFFGDAADKLIDFEANSDLVGVTNGDFSGFTTMPADHGEIIGGTQYEWKVSTANAGAVNWDACRTAGQINVRFETTDGSPGFVTQDSTANRGFNVPTSITLQGFGAQDGATPLLAYAAALMLLVLVTFAIVRARRVGS